MTSSTFPTQIRSSSFDLAKPPSQEHTSGTSRPGDAMGKDIAQATLAFAGVGVDTDTDAGAGANGGSGIAAGDPLYPYQWHLHNTGQRVFADTLPTAGIDLNLGTLHQQGITGKGVVIGIHEHGRIDPNHEDLAANLVACDPLEPSVSTDHATAIAGIIAAVAGNGKGGRGVAPEAQLLDMRAPSAKDQPAPRLQNMSVGNTPILFMPYSESEYPDVDLNTHNGAAFFKAAGNEFGAAEQAGVSAAMCSEATLGTGISCLNATADTLNSYAQSVTVAAVNASGKRASYSSAGSAIWVSGLGGEYGYEKAEVAQSDALQKLPPVGDAALYAPALVTTDASGLKFGLNRDEPGAPRYNALDGGSLSKVDSGGNYTARANGTSSAAPTVTGVAALMLQVNPELSWRDIKYILATTARKIDPEQPKITWQGLTLDDAWVANAAGRSFSNWYGFGLVDATAAVRAARNYTPLGPLRNSGWRASTENGVPIAGKDANGTGARIAIADEMAIETVQLRLRTTHKDPHQLHIELTSPSGTRSIILPALTMIRTAGDEFSIDLAATNAFLDEPAKGMWTLKVIDALDPSPSTKIVSWDLRVLGH
jgi:subtilisin-like proprotein convertase family protein